jgi:hypothetical protein
MRLDDGGTIDVDIVLDARTARVGARLRLQGLPPPVPKGEVWAVVSAEQCLLLAESFARAAEWLTEYERGRPKETDVAERVVQRGSKA